MLREKINIAGNNGINIAGFLGIVALGIKFTKAWYMQQINNRVLARKKIANELKLLKIRIQPEFLYASLQSLYNKESTDRNDAAEMLLKFSELLSYMLYECDDDFVPVLRELVIINEFIELEKMMGKTNLTITNTIGNINNKYISSFILLSIIQHCVLLTEKAAYEKSDYTDIKIYDKDNFLYLDIYIKTINTGIVKDSYAAIVNTFLNRLEALYGNNYKLELSEPAEDKFQIKMRLLLTGDLLNQNKNITEINYAYAHI